MRKRNPISPYLFSTNSVRLRVKVFFLLIFAILLTAGVVHFIDNISTNNSLTKVYSQKAEYRDKYQQTQQDFNFTLGQLNNQLNCFQLQTKLDQTTCQTHNNTFN